MTRLTVRIYGETKTTEHETPYAAHHAMLRSAASHGVQVTHDLDVVKGTMSGELLGRTDKPHGSWIIADIR